MSNETNKIVIWWFTDGKPGHENQAQGLIDALGRICSIEVHQLTPVSSVQAFQYLFKKNFPLSDRPKPTMLLGVGHRTHLSMLAARRTHGGKAIVLMKPTLPRRLFDLCIIPQHDGVAEKNNVKNTVGVLNRIRPSDQLNLQKGMILIGGPSGHYAWHDDALLERIDMILQRNPIEWTLTTSRRTPISFLHKINKWERDNLTVVPADKTGSDWLPQQLQTAGKVWITEDSVSMVYEALTAGGACGVLPVERKKPSRVSSGIDKLIDEHCLTPFDQWMMAGKMYENSVQLNESARIAEILEHELRE